MYPCLLILVIGGAGLWAQQPKPKFVRPAPEQPLPFSHRKHAGELKLACQQCHPMPDTGEFATLPATGVCMKCHASVAQESPHIQKLKEFHEAGREIAWKRVYRIPDYVFFSHRHHVINGKVSCAGCHGPVEERDQLRREKDISMAACMDCHRSQGASNACNFCHEPR